MVVTLVSDATKKTDAQAMAIFLKFYFETKGNNISSAEISFRKL